MNNNAKTKNLGKSLWAHAKKTHLRWTAISSRCQMIREDNNELASLLTCSMHISPLQDNNSTVGCHFCIDAAEIQKKSL